MYLSGWPKIGFATEKMDLKQSLGSHTITIIRGAELGRGTNLRSIAPLLAQADAVGLTQSARENR